MFMRENRPFLVFVVMRGLTPENSIIHEDLNQISTNSVLIRSLVNGFEDIK